MAAELIKEKPTCRVCGSDDVFADATATWNINTQAYELVSALDSGHCITCESDTKYFNWIPITEIKE